MSVIGFRIDGSIQKYDYNALDNKPSSTGGDGLTEVAKSALLQIARKVIYADEHGETYYQNLYNALYSDKVVNITNILDGCKSSNVSTIIAENSAYFAEISANAGYSLSGATADITMGGVEVTGVYSNGVINIPNVTGDLVITITAVSITTSISATYTQSGLVYSTDSLDILKPDLVVTANMSDSTTMTIPSTDYVLSGELVEGTSSITVAYGGKTTTFDVVVSSTLLYSLENYTMTNGEYFDTNVSPFAAGIDTTILLDINITSVSNSESSPSYLYALLSISDTINNKNTNCLLISKPGQYNTYIRPVFYGGGNTDGDKIATTTAGRKRIVIIHTANNNTMTAIGKNADEEAITRTVGPSYFYTYAPTDSHLLIGRNLTGQGLPPGTINQLKVYSVILPQEEIDAFLA